MSTTRIINTKSATERRLLKTITKGYEKYYSKKYYNVGKGVSIDKLEVLQELYEINLMSEKCCSIDRDKLQEVTNTFITKLKLQ